MMQWWWWWCWGVIPKAMTVMKTAMKRKKMTRMARMARSGYWLEG